MSENTKYMSAIQKQRLTDIMSSKKDLRSGKFTANFTKKTAQKEWQDIANVLNALPGAQKCWQSWRKSWQDLLCKAKRRKGAYSNALNRTGGGSIEVPPLSEIETNIAALIDPRSITGHIESQESEAVFEFGTNNLDSEAMHDEINRSTEVEEETVVYQIITDEEADVVLPQESQRKKKINLKTLMKEKVEIKKKLLEAKIQFYTAFIDNIKKQTSAIENLVLAINSQRNV